MLATACGGSSTDSASDAEEHADEEEHAEEEMDHGHVEAPDEFASLTNPFGDDHEAVEAGETIFQTNCASCHGSEGMGDGAAAEALDPKPATLADGMMMDTLSDGYLFWRVSKGGALEPFNSAMPSWEAALTEDQRWQVISYVRTLAQEMEGMDHSEDDESHSESDSD
jgi:mono/diheme cytochrome c family protein